MQLLDRTWTPSQSGWFTRAMLKAPESSPAGYYHIGLKRAAETIMRIVGLARGEPLPATSTQTEQLPAENSAATQVSATPLMEPTVGTSEAQMGSLLWRMGRGAPNWANGGGLLNTPWQQRWRRLMTGGWGPQQVPQTQRGDFSRLYAQRMRRPGMSDGRVRR